MNPFRAAKRMVGEQIARSLLRRGFGKDHIKQMARDIRLRGGPNSETLQVFLQSLWPVETELELIRVGRHRDGGYVVPDDLAGLRACFSPGVGDSTDFEDAIYKQFGIQSFLADGTVDGPPKTGTHLSFARKNIESYDSESTMTLEAWVAMESSASDELILQMDIEGSEYAALLGLSSDRLLQFRILVIEFHGLDAMGSKIGFQVIKATFRKLTQNFCVVHIHPNSRSPVFDINGICVPRVMEFTFLRKDRARRIGYAKKFPHPLDAPNVPSDRELVLPEQWRSP